MQFCILDFQLIYSMTERASIIVRIGHQVIHFRLLIENRAQSQPMFAFAYRLEYYCSIANASTKVYHAPYGASSQIYEFIVK